MTGLAAIVGVWAGAFFTLSVLSFLFKETPVYKFTEHLVVGVSAGYWLVILITTSLTDLLLEPLAKDFTNGGPFASSFRFEQFILNLVPLALGVMMLLRLFPKTAWIGRVPIALILGTGAGVAIPTALQTFVTQPLWATLRLPVVPTSLQAAVASLAGAPAPAGDVVTLWGALNNLVIVGGVFCGVVYFFFSKEHKGVTGKAADIGIWILMVGFGSTFGFTVMSRVSLLVGRFEFLLNDWLIAGFWRLIFPG
jgi:hypothetical protein